MAELDELREQAEHGAEENLAAVTVTMAILAVLVASVSLMGHRAHTEELLKQTEVTDQWAYYQAKDIRRHTYELPRRNLRVRGAERRRCRQNEGEIQHKEVERYAKEQEDIESEVRKAEREVKVQQRRADRFDLGEVLLEAALVICSITLLTRKRIFWLIGSVLGDCRPGYRRRRPFDSLVLVRAIGCRRPRHARLCPRERRQPETELSAHHWAAHGAHLLPGNLLDRNDVAIGRRNKTSSAE